MPLTISEWNPNIFWKEAISLNKAKWCHWPSDSVHKTITYKFSVRKQFLISSQCTSEYLSNNSIDTHTKEQAAFIITWDEHTIVRAFSELCKFQPPFCFLRRPAKLWMVCICIQGYISITAVALCRQKHSTHESQWQVSPLNSEGKSL